MAVFRIEKNKNYTIMSNHHLRNVTLSLKAKGLLSQILSLPENWDYTLKGLSHINRESVEASVRPTRRNRHNQNRRAKQQKRERMLRIAVINSRPNQKRLPSKKNSRRTNKNFRRKNPHPHERQAKIKMNWGANHAYFKFHRGRNKFYRHLQS